MTAVSSPTKTRLNVTSVLRAPFLLQARLVVAKRAFLVSTPTKQEALRVTSAFLQETTGRVTTQLVVLLSVHCAQRCITGTDQIACHVTTKLWIAVKQG